jgi:hypothetical protein
MMMHHNEQSKEERKALACVCCGWPATGFHKGDPMCGRCKRRAQNIENGYSVTAL